MRVKSGAACPLLQNGAFYELLLSCFYNLDLCASMGIPWETAELCI